MLKLLIISPILGIISISIITKIKNLLYTTITTSHLTLPLKSPQSVSHTLGGVGWSNNENKQKCLNLEYPKPNWVWDDSNKILITQSTTLHSVVPHTTMNTLPTQPQYPTLLHSVGDRDRVIEELGLDVELSYKASSNSRNVSNITNYAKLKKVWGNIKWSLNNREIGEISGIITYFISLYILLKYNSNNIEYQLRDKININWYQLNIGIDGISIILIILTTFIFSILFIIIPNILFPSPIGTGRLGVHSNVEKLKQPHTPTKTQLGK